MRRTTTRRAGCSMLIFRRIPAMPGHSSTADTATTRREGHRAAENYYRKAIAADPKQFEARLALGLLLAQQGSEEAQTQMETAVTLEPNPPNPAAKAQAYRTLARLVRQSDPDTAKQALLEALKLTPETASDTLLTAEIAEAEGDKDIAEQAYRRVLKVDPRVFPGDRRAGPPAAGGEKIFRCGAAC